MDRVVVEGADRNFLPVQKDGLARDRSGRGDVAVGEHDAARGVDDEAGGVGGGGGLGVEGARLRDSVFFLLRLRERLREVEEKKVDRRFDRMPLFFFLSPSSLSPSCRRHNPIHNKATRLT